MFTGIVEALGEVVGVTTTGSNRDLLIRASIATELKVDQSVSHNGVCLTVVEINGDTYSVTAVQETLERSNLGALKVGDAGPRTCGYHCEVRWRRRPEWQLDVHVHPAGAIPFVGGEG